MEKTGRSTKVTKNPTKKNFEPISDLEAQIHKAHPLIKNYLSELRKEISRLHIQNAKQEVSHYSALEKLKADHAEQIKTVPVINIVSYANPTPTHDAPKG